MSKKYSHLDWIDDDSLSEAVKYVYQTYKDALASSELKHIQSNIVDPFLTIFEVSLRKDLVFEEWLKQEAQRQLQKTLSNSIGNFHHKILSSAKGWVDLGLNHETGLDIKKNDSTIWAELKNKHNTIKGEDYKSVFQKLETIANQHKESTVYLVQIIRKRQKPYDEIWSFKAKGKSYSHQRVRLVSGENFYEIVAGQNSLSQLFGKLPEIIEKEIPDKDKLKASDIKAYQELKGILGKDFTNEKGFEYLFEQAYQNYPPEKN